MQELILNQSRRDFLKFIGALTLATQLDGIIEAKDEILDISPEDGIFVANEDSNTIRVINPNTNSIDTTINLTSFDEDPRPPLFYIAYEQDELHDTSNAGQTVAAAFYVSDQFNPKFISQIPLGSLRLPSGELRNKKSINLVYIRPGHKGQTA